MSVLDDLIAAARDVKIAKAQNPRAVQSVQQRQVEARHNAGVVQNEQPRPATTAATNFMSKIPGGKTTLFALGGLLAAGFVVKKVL